MIDFDVETVGLQWYTGELFLAQFLDDDGNLEVLSHPEDRGRIQWWLDRDDDFRAWNSKFDLHFLAAHGYLLPTEDRWHDAMVRARIIDERSTQALKGRAKRLWPNEDLDAPERELRGWLAEELKRRREMSKNARLDWLEANGIEPGRGTKANRRYTKAQIDEVPLKVGELVPPSYKDAPREIIVPYAAQDVILTRRVDDLYAPKLDDELRRVYDLEQEILGALYCAEKRGLPIDRAAAARLQYVLAERLDEIDSRARELAGISNFNPGSSQQILEALKRRGADLTFVSSTAGGSLSMDQENLEAVDDDLASAILEFRAEQKMLGTYISPMLNRTWDSKMSVWRDPFIHTDGRLHAAYRQVGARTGRMSSSDPNVQNFPRDDLRVRYLFRAEPGMKLVTADFSNMEMTIFAAYAGEGRILRTLQEGGDLHELTAKMVGLKGRQRVNGLESPRQQGKVFNFSIVYGAGVRSIRKYFRVPQNEARAMRDRYMAAYPEVKRLQQLIEWKLADQGYVKTLYGRRQRLEKSVREEAYKFTNYLVQGTAADMMKMAVARLHKQGVPLVGFVHDEIVAHVEEQDAEEVSRLLVAAMEAFPELSEIVPVKADAQIVDRLSDAKKPGYVPDHERAPLAA